MRKTQAHTPMLTRILREKSAALAPHFKPGFLQREQSIFQFKFDSDEPFFLEVSDTDFKFAAGETAQATITLFLKDHSTCWSLLDGSMDGMRAFMDGSYRADGNIVLSQLLLYLFKRDDATLIYEVQD